MNKLLPLLFLSITGCAIPGAPVGWGGTHQVIQENEESVTYLYDALVGGYGAVMSAATQHCKRYGKSPVPTVDSKKGVLYTQTFECR